MALSFQQNSAAADFDATNNFSTVQADLWISFVIQADGAYGGWRSKGANDRCGFQSFSDGEKDGRYGNVTAFLN